MKKKSIRKFNKFIVLFFVFIIFAVNINIAGASMIESDAKLLNDAAEIKILGQSNSMINNAGFSNNSTVGSIAATVITAFLSLLGIIFVGLMIYAGYHWMTAGGEEEKINKAKDTIRRAIIGLIIVMSAYAITRFVFTSLPESGSSSGSGYDTDSSN